MIKLQHKFYIKSGGNGLNSMHVMLEKKFNLNSMVPLNLVVVHAFWSATVQGFVLHQVQVLVKFIITQAVIKSSQQSQYINTVTTTNK